MRLKNFVLAAALLVAARTAVADSVQIIISTTGTSYYQVNVGGNTGQWEVFAPASGSWDSMQTNPGPTAAGTSVGPTTDFELSGITTTGSLAVSVVNDAWAAASVNTSGNAEAALVLTSGGTTSTSAVSNMLILDGGGTNATGLLLYNVPTLNGSGDVTVTTPVASYGYTGGVVGHYTPGVTPITELGGLHADLEFNGGFAGSAADGSNISPQQGQTIQDPRSGLFFLGDVYNADVVGGDPNQVQISYPNGLGGSTTESLSPTVYFETTPAVGAAVPLPPAVTTGLVMLASLGLVAAWRRGRWNGTR